MVDALVKLIVKLVKPKDSGKMQFRRFEKKM